MKKWNIVEKYWYIIMTREGNAMKCIIIESIIKKVIL